MSAAQFMGATASPNAGAFSSVAGAGMPNLSLAGAGLGLYGNMGRPSFPGSVGGGLGSLSNVGMGFNGQLGLANSAALFQASAGMQSPSTANQNYSSTSSMLQPVDADIIVAPGTDHASRVANLEYQNLLKYNAFLYACLPDRQQRVMATNIHEFLTMVRGRRIIHRGATNSYFLGSAVEGPFMISQEICSEPCRLAAHFEHPTWILDGLVTKEAKKNLWVRRDPKEPFNKAWKKLTGPELKMTLKEEGFVNLLHLPTGVTITKVEGSVVETVGTKKPGKKRGPKPKDKSDATADKTSKDKEGGKTESTKDDKKEKTEAPTTEKNDAADTAATTSSEPEKKSKGKKKPVIKATTDSEKTNAKGEVTKEPDETPKKITSPTKKSVSDEKPKRGAKRTSESAETASPAKRGRKKKEESEEESSTPKKKSPTKAATKAKGKAAPKTTTRAKVALPTASKKTKQTAKSKKESPPTKSAAGKTKAKTPPSTGRRSKRTRV